MTKTFLHGRTEAVRTVQPESVNFVKASSLLIYEATSPYIFTPTDLLFGGDGTGKDQCAPPRMQEARRAYEGVFEGSRPGPVRVWPCDLLLMLS